MIRHSLALVAICSLGIAAIAAPPELPSDFGGEKYSPLINDIREPLTHNQRFMVKTCGKLILLIDTEKGHTWMLKEKEKDASVKSGCSHHWQPIPQVKLPEPANATDDRDNDDPFEPPK
jgi:hypothetical protein